MKTIEKKIRGNWIFEIEYQKSIMGVEKYVLYVFDRTLRQFALIARFDSCKEAKNYLKNFLKNS